MQKQTPIKKSAFAPFKPSPSAIQAAREAAKAKAKQQASPSKKEAPPKEQAQKKESEPLPSKVEIWLEPVSRDDRTVCGWGYLAVRSGTVRAIVIIVNLAYPLVARVLAARDARMIAWLVGLSLAEVLLYRRRPGDVWLSKTLEQLRLSVFPDNPDLRSLTSIQFIADALAESAPFKRMAAKLVSADKLPTEKHWIATVILSASNE